MSLRGSALTVRCMDWRVSSGEDLCITAEGGDWLAALRRGRVEEAVGAVLGAVRGAARDRKLRGGMVATGCGAGGSCEEGGRGRMRRQSVWQPAARCAKGRQLGPARKSELRRGSRPPVGTGWPLAKARVCTPVTLGALECRRAAGVEDLSHHHTLYSPARRLPPIHCFVGAKPPRAPRGLLCHWGPTNARRTKQ